jgi:hypothetical protein
MCGLCGHTLLWDSFREVGIWMEIIISWFSPMVIWFECIPTSVLIHYGVPCIQIGGLFCLFDNLSMCSY